MQQEKPGDYVVATGQCYTVRDFVNTVFNYLGMDWKKYVVSDDSYRRPNEVPELRGDASKIRTLGWEPEVTFEQLVKLMVDNDMELCSKSIQT